MKLKLAGLLIPLAALCGCNGDHAPAENGPLNPSIAATQSSQDEVVATVRGQAITRKELDEPLIAGYGLNDLMLVVQRDLARQELANQKLVMTPQDIVNERQLTLVGLGRTAHTVEKMGGTTTEPDDEPQMSPSEYDELLKQVLAKQRVTPAEFEIVMETNAILRKIAEPAVIKQLTDDAVRNQFNIEYGEKVQTQYIVSRNMNDVEDVLRDLAAGKSFGDVARARSIDQKTAASGGELAPFTLQDNRVPAEIRQMAFSLKVGQISDPLQYGEFFYIIKLVDIIPPRHAKFEDYRDAVRKDLYTQSVQAAIVALRQKLGKMALETLDIQEPVLQKQWLDRMAASNGQIQDMQRIRKEMDKEHQNSSTSRPSTMPATRPAPVTTAPMGH